MLLRSSRSPSTATATSVQAGHDDDHDKYSVVEIVLPADPDCLAGFWHVTTARRMNERGEVVGDDTCVIATGDETAPAVIGGSDAFRWHRALGATMLPALSPDSRDTYARDINESGTAIGWENRSGLHLCRTGVAARRRSQHGDRARGLRQLRRVLDR